MYKKVFLILCAVILLGVLASCGQDDYDDGYNNEPPDPTYRYGTITLDNKTSSSITEIYLKPSTESDWGESKLISETGLMPERNWWIDVRIPVDSNSIYVDLRVATAEYDAALYNIRVDEGEKVQLYATIQLNEPAPLKIMYYP